MIYQASKYISRSAAVVFTDGPQTESGLGLSSLAGVPAKRSPQTAWTVLGLRAEYVGESKDLDRFIELICVCYFHFW